MVTFGGVMPCLIPSCIKAMVWSTSSGIFPKRARISEKIFGRVVRHDGQNLWHALLGAR